MAQKTVVSLVDDIDGSDGDETVLFALDGVRYEIDLSAENAAELRETLAPYLGVARRSGRQPRVSAPRRAKRAVATANSAEVRAWGRKNGWTVSDRGRIPAELAAAYAEKH